MRLAILALCALVVGGCDDSRSPLVDARILAVDLCDAEAKPMYEGAHILTVRLRGLYFVMEMEQRNRIDYACKTRVEEAAWKPLRSSLPTEP